MLLLTARVVVLGCLATAALAAQAPAPPLERLGRSRTIYVVHAAGRDDLADLVTAAIKDWGRWTLVSTPEQADLLATVGGTGSNLKGTVRLTLTSGVDGATVWHSEDTGRQLMGRSGFVRALNVLIERLQELTPYPAFSGPEKS